ncbi:MAG: glycine zipper family protein [Leptolyngbya sp. SIO4C1]|nr:glycine zipper family protein [Leptolyngbya sp. SIO4C1]
METSKDPKHNPDANPDPITGQPGAHPVGTGVGAAGAGAVGTVVGGAVGGPVGAVVGAAVGAVAGGLAGKGIAEQVDPTVEDAYWRDNYRSRPYVESDYDYDQDYAAAYRTGYTGYSTYAQEHPTYAEAEPRLRADYEKQRGSSRLDWNRAKQATQDAWNRVDTSVRGRRDNDDYWRNNYQSRPYIESGYDYSHYAPAYQIGYDSYTAYGLTRGMTYEQAEPHIRSDYERHHGNSGLGWEKAKHAAKDAWHRVKDTFSRDNRSYR